MPNHQSAIKRHRQSLKRRDRNRMTRSTLRTAIAKVRAALEDGDVNTARTLFKQAEQSVARAGSRHILHPRNASRKISRLGKLVAAKSKKK